MGLPRIILRRAGEPCGCVEEFVLEQEETQTKGAAAPRIKMGHAPTKRSIESARNDPDGIVDRKSCPVVLPGRKGDTCGLGDPCCEQMSRVHTARAGAAGLGAALRIVQAVAVIEPVQAVHDPNTSRAGKGPDH